MQTPTAADVLLEDIEPATRRRLADAVETCSRELGLPGDRITRHVERGDAGAGLLVLGNARRGRVAEALLGSVAQSYVHHTTCPVVLVPAPDEGSGPT